jgi:transcriptional regulator with XRE-family HTH domain
VQAFLPEQREKPACVQEIDWNYSVTLVMHQARMTEMSSFPSCRTLRFPLDPPVLTLKPLQDAFRATDSESYLPDRLRGHIQFARQGRVVDLQALMSAQLPLNGAKMEVQFETPDDDEKYRTCDIHVKRKIASAMHAEELSKRIRMLRKSLGLNQKDFGSLCDVKQVAVSQWEAGDRIPGSKALFKMSEVATLADRQWWRDRAAEQAGVDISAPDAAFGAFEVPALVTKIPLIPNHQKVGTKVGPVSVADVERILYFSSDLVPEGGKLEAARITSSTTELVAVIDVSRQDAEHLVGKMVAVRTVEGIEVRWLAREDGTLFLLPFQPGQRVKPMRYKGEWSIVGAVRWLGEAPHSEKAEPGKRRH